MKNILLLAFLVLLVESINCRIATDESTDMIPDNGDTEEISDGKQFDGETQINTDNDFKGDETDTESTKQNVDLKAEATRADGDKEVAEQCLQLKIGQGKKLAITLSPDSGSGVVYTRWGRTHCRRGAELVYAGYAGGSGHHERGGGANLLCMPTTGVGHLSTQNPGHLSFIYGSEYQSHNRIWHNHDYNVPCAVCYVPDKSTKLQLPGRITCPDSWTQEYRGYIMAEYKNHQRNAVFECIDEAGEKIPNSNRDTNGALLYFVTPVCNRGIPCGPYHPNIAITCSVCTR